MSTFQPLTERQTQVYRFIVDYARKQGKPPTIAEIGRHLGLRSTNSVHKLVVALEAKGRVRRTPHAARGLEIVDDADAPTPFADDPPGVLMLKATEGVGRRARALTSDMAEHPLPRSRRPLVVDPSLLPEDVDLDACIGVVAGDDGMHGIGIYKGDRVIVEEAEWAHIPNGALVAAIFYDLVVVRRFEYANGRLHFHASSKTYTDESPRPDDAEFFVIGRALTVLRSLG